jgi:hypothetical protein
VDLSTEDVTGTCTDSLLVVSNELHKQVVSKQPGTTQACSTKSCASKTDAKNAAELPSKLAPAGQSSIIEQVCCLSAVELGHTSAFICRVGACALSAGHLPATLLLRHGVVCCRSAARCRISVSPALLPQRSWVVWCCKPCSDRLAMHSGYLPGCQQSLLLKRLLAMTCMQLRACTTFPSPK